MTTGAHEVTTVDKLQHPSLLGGGDGGETLTPRVCVNWWGNFDFQVSCKNYVTSRHLGFSSSSSCSRQALYQNLLKFIIVLPYGNYSIDQTFPLWPLLFT